MEQEIIIAVVGAFSAALALFLNRVVSNVTRTKQDKKKEKAEAGIIEIEEYSKRIDISSIKNKAIRDIVSDTYSLVDNMNESYKRVNKELAKMLEDNLRLEKAVFEMTKRAENAERHRDWYKSLLDKLLCIVKEKCPDISLSEFEDYYEKTEDFCKKNEYNK